MLKLFALRNTKTGVISSTAFISKAAAKQERDRLNGGPPNQEGIELVWVVTPGPDHARRPK